jgi:hypothetical protein
MVTSTRGLLTGPLILAMVALVIASANIGLEAGRSRESSKQPPERAAARSTPAAPTESRPMREVRVDGPVRRLAPAGDPSGDDVATSIALCPSGTRAVSGGFRTITGGGETFYSDALTDGRVGWAAGAVNKLAAPGTVQAFAYCAPAGKRGAPGGRTLAKRRATARREADALVDRYKSLRAAQF